MVDLKGNPFYLKDEQIAWVNRTLENLRLDEKVGQLFCPIGMSTDEKALFDLAANKKVGGLLFRPGKGEEVQQLSLRTTANVQLRGHHLLMFPTVPQPANLPVEDSL